MDSDQFAKIACGSRQFARSGAKCAQNWLICVELRAERLVPGGEVFTPTPAEMPDRQRTMLAYARKAKWEVVHLHSAARGRKGGPIEGLEPLADEPVFSVPTGTNVNSSALLRWARTQSDAVFYLMGFAVSEIVLPTLATGLEHGLRMVMVSDALADSANEAWRARERAHAIASKFGFIAARSTSELISGSAGRVIRIEDFRREGKRGWQ